MISNIAHIVCITFKIFLNLFEMGVCFPHFGFDEISTPVMRTMLTMVNVGQINISDFACAHCVYEIYSVLKLFEIPVCFAHFGFSEISTPVMRQMPTMVNVVQIITSHIAHTLYIRFIAFWKVSKLLFVSRILAFTKFLLRWCPPR